MMFINMVRCDLKNGLFKRWKTFLFVALLFSFIAFFAKVDFDALLRMNPCPIKSDITLGDYFCYLFGGTSAGNNFIEFLDENGIVNNMVAFSFPSIWALVFLVLLLITLQYPYEDLMGFGKNVIVLTGKIHHWWFSKCIWIIANVVLYFAVAISFYSLAAVLFGAKPSLSIGTYYPYYRFDILDYLTEEPWNIVPTLIMQVPVGIGLCMLELTFSMISSRLASYLMSTAIILASAYWQNIFLFPNVSMIARSEALSAIGLNPVFELLIIAWMSLLSVLIGYIYLRNTDIINKVR